MNAIAFKIVQFNECSQKEGEEIMSGIVRDVYDNIYPQTETGITEMPYEIELRHFKEKGYKITYFEFNLSYNEAEKFKISNYNF